MSRFELPVWMRRRMKRRLAKASGDKASLRIFLKNLRQRQAVKQAEELPDNVILFPGVMRQRMAELKIA